MIKLITNNPIALDSDDHHFPDGIHFDNYINPTFIQDIENYYLGKKIDFLDLGCAGGALTVEMSNRGHNALGLEGSDHCLNPKKSVTDKLGAMPMGYQNWQKWGNKNLFTCDITYDYSIVTHTGELQTFDLITCFDVMEHFYEDRIDKFCEMVTKHLKPDGLFVANVALFHLIKDKILEEGQVEYHKSLFTHEKWLDLLAKHFCAVEYPFTCTNRKIDNKSDGSNLVYAGKKI